MINQFEVPMYLGDAIPEISEKISQDKKNSVYKIMNILIVFMRTNIEIHNFKAVKRCLKIADKLYSKGNGLVRNAIENVFVYSFTNIFQAYPAEKKKLLAAIPITLYSLYIAQLYRRGC